MDFKTLSPAYLTSLGVIFCGALMVGSSSPWLIWLGWILLILALGLNVLAFVLSVGKAKGDPTPALVTNLDGFESSVSAQSTAVKSVKLLSTKLLSSQRKQPQRLSMKWLPLKPLRLLRRPSTLKLQRLPRFVRKSPPNPSRLLSVHPAA